MDILSTEISGCFEIVPKMLCDARGTFVKVFHEDIFREYGLETNFKEEFYSVSYKRVLRGLHLQTPPKDHAKLVYCVQGVVFDAAVDVRVGSPTFGKHITRQLSAEKGNMLYLTKGIAHGFYVISEQALMVYKVTTTHSEAHDTGIHWNSAGIDWPDPDPILSVRDTQSVFLSQFISPFIYVG